MRRILQFHTCLLAALGLPAAQLTHGRHLATQGRHMRAVRCFALAARAGSAGARYELGRAYVLGLGVPSCPALGLHWLSKAALAADTDAQLLLASLALMGVTRPATEPLFEGRSAHPDPVADYPLALHWSRLAAASGSAPAQALLGFILTAGPPELRDLAEGDDCYRRSAEAGCAQGQLGWSVALLRRDAAHEIHRARTLLRAAAEANLPMAHSLLGIIAENGIGEPEDLAAAALHHRKAAELGHAASQLGYGLALLRGRGVTRNLFQGESWLRRAALSGEAQAAATLGELYTGSGELPPNNAEAVIWFRRAAEAGHAGAARSLAHLHLRGTGIGADPQEALHWLRLAVANGDTQARTELAELTLTSGTSEQDRLATFDWFRQLAEAGDPGAAFNVGLCHAEGIGTVRDDEQALAWFSRAAGDMAIAQYWCGRMLAEGRGAALDLPAARMLFLRAAEQGLRDAEAAAGEMLINGRGGAPDPAAATILFTRAAASDHAGALFALGILAREDRDAAAAFLRRAAKQGHPGARALLDREAA